MYSTQHNAPECHARSTHHWCQTHNHSALSSGSGSCVMLTADWVVIVSVVRGLWPPWAARPLGCRWPQWALRRGSSGVRGGGRAWDKFYPSFGLWKCTTDVSFGLYLSVISGVVDLRNYRWQSLNVPQCGVTPDPVKSWHNPLNWNLTDDENQQMSSKPFISETRLPVDRVKPWLTKMINSSSSNTMIC